MITPKRYQMAIAYILLVVVMTIYTISSANKVDFDNVDEVAVKEPVGFNWSDFLNFKQFTQMFHKIYRSPIEELRRQKIYLANLFRSFTSKNMYMRKETDSYLDWNDMSDWTQNEWESTLIKPEVYIEYLQNDAIYSGQEQQQENGGMKSLRNLLSYPISLVENLKTFYENKGSVFRLINNALVRLVVTYPDHRPDLPDEIFSDHRQNGCLNTPKSQGSCGSCYIFSVTALYEWMFCQMNEGQKKIEFSEQYVIDCGTPSYLRGCNGGFERYVANFVNDFGFEKFNDYEYAAKQEKCPYDERAQIEGFNGQFKLDKPQLRRVAFDDIEKQLKLSPVIFTIYVGSDFGRYGGGLDDGSNCEKVGGLHSVLIVGSGRQNGHEYWLIRNSYGSRWGEQGYYKLKKSSRCYLFLDFGQVLAPLHHSQFTADDLESFESRQKALQTAMKSVNFLSNPKHDRDMLLNKRSELKIESIIAEQKAEAARKEKEAKKGEQDDDMDVFDAFSGISARR